MILAEMLYDADPGECYRCGLRFDESDSPRAERHTQRRDGQTVPLCRGCCPCPSPDYGDQ